MVQDKLNRCQAILLTHRNPPSLREFAQRPFQGPQVQAGLLVKLHPLETAPLVAKLVEDLQETVANEQLRPEFRGGFDQIKRQTNRLSRYPVGKLRLKSALALGAVMNRAKPAGVGKPGDGFVHGRSR